MLKMDLIKPEDGFDINYVGVQIKNEIFLSEEEITDQLYAVDSKQVVNCGHSFQTRSSCRERKIVASKMNQSRLVAFSQKEKNALTEIIKHYPIVECKKTDSGSVHEKNEAWNSIANLYNRQPGIQTKRKSAQLKKLWSNLKQRKKRENTSLHYSALLNGVGPPDVIEDPLALVTEVSHTDMFIDCPWDSQSNLENKGVQELVEKPIKVNEEREHIMNTRSKKHVLGESGLGKKLGMAREREARLHKLQACEEMQTELHSLRLQLLKEEMEQKRREFLASERRKDELHVVQLETAKILLRKAKYDAEKHCI